jgi:glutamate-1-semialdehyde 2,1-aminomutase
LTYKRPYFSFHGGTFSANPITMTAGLATLKILKDGRLIDRLNTLGEKVRERLKKTFERNSVAAQLTGTSSLFNVHFTEEKVNDANGVSKADRNKQIEYHLNLIQNGIFVLPTHTAALSSAHSEADIEKLLSATEAYATSAQTGK